jgi:hypothetical protein
VVDDKVADELIDMWNTGSRYTVEELASLAGLGSLSFDLLADSINSTLTANETDATSMRASFGT